MRQQARILRHTRWKTSSAGIQILASALPELTTSSVPLAVLLPSCSSDASSSCVSAMWNQSSPQGRGLALQNSVLRGKDPEMDKKVSPVQWSRQAQGQMLSQVNEGADGAPSEGPYRTPSQLLTQLSLHPSSIQPAFSDSLPCTPLSCLWPFKLNWCMLSLLSCLTSSSLQRKLKERIPLLPVTVKMQRIFSGKFTNNHQMGLLHNESKILWGARRRCNIVQLPEPNI